ncbi:AAA family ATPase [Phytohabitans sp. LJ34]|uniref:AAA family ATPase n=1 Tax=Phytohabitans sp. LJ34 TaxID=3452217 RepID=UPI003F8C1010
MPTDVKGFTGRNREIAALDALLESAGDGASAVAVGIVAGSAGVGKTSLAVHWAHRVADRFPDGHLYVDLRGYAQGPPMRPVEALGQFLRALGMPSTAVPVEVTEAAALYRSRLAGQRVLVVLDNAASVDQIRPLLPGSAGCLVLVTARTRLSGLIAREGAQRFALDVLTAEEARTLLGRAIGTERVRAEEPAVDELARACAYLPLALRIAAANLTEEPRRSIATYVAELTTGNRLATLHMRIQTQTYDGNACSGSF